MKCKYPESVCVNMTMLHGIAYCDSVPCSLRGESPPMTNAADCPNCGGRMQSESIGWKCEKCRGFIDMKGKFHPYEEKPFMPPMTNADRIRAMSDEELAEFIPNWSYTKACKCDEETFVGCDNECEKCVAEWLQQPVREEDT